MSTPVPRVAAIHDISCFGRCSLTVIIPTLSSLGIQVCPLPTAVLSTHLSGFKNVKLCDFTTLMPDFFSHWQNEKITFDSIYSGFLASEKQIEIVSTFIDCFAQKDKLILVDPVMGDEGKLYSIYTPKLIKEMKALVHKASIITPNYTEACFLLGEPYQKLVLNINIIKKWLTRLSEIGPSTVIITGIPVGDGKIMNAGYDKNTNRFYQDYCDYIPVSFPGTGDIYASVMLGFLLQNEPIHIAMKYASEFVSLAINATINADTPTREGVLLEKVLPWLSHRFWYKRLKNTKKVYKLDFAEGL